MCVCVRDRENEKERYRLVLNAQVDNWYSYLKAIRKRECERERMRERERDDHSFSSIFYISSALILLCAIALNFSSMLV